MPAQYARRRTGSKGPVISKRRTSRTFPYRARRSGSVGFPAAYSNQASSEALEMEQTGVGASKATVNTARLEVLQFTHGVIKPTFTESEAEIVAREVRARLQAVDRGDRLAERRR